MIDHPYQLRRVDLEDFKSVGHASVELRPLTVVVGTNSSGKSTLLQSILAVTQAVRAGTNTAEFPLNGEFVRLGTFDETRNFMAQSGSPMMIAFELLDTMNQRLVSQRSRVDTEDSPRTQLTWRAYVDNARSDDENGSGTSGFARLASLQVELGLVWPDNGGVTTRLLSCDLGGFETDAAKLTDLPVVSRSASLSRAARGAIGASGRVQDWKTGESSAIDAVVLVGGVPQALLEQMNQLSWLAEVWWNIAHEVLDEALDEQKRQAGGERAVRPSRRAIGQALEDFGELGPITKAIASVDSEEAVRKGFEAPIDTTKLTLYRRLARLAPDDRKSVAESIIQLGETQFRDGLRGEFDEEDWTAQDVLVEHAGRAGDVMYRASFVSQRFFRTSVRYLGPLREAPHVLYDPGPSKLDLGVRGEYSAAVLHAQANTTVVMPTPDGDGEERLLSEALDFWLQRFELADRARSEDRGRIGIGLSVTPKGLNQPVDLTSVGVGVSQILPVILLCLLAEPGTLLVLEQPELHLHPKLQQDLADFLLACALSGRQLVIESHSEHLVNRLRKRIAQDETDETFNLIRLVFAENRDGVTSYREPEINPYGGLGDDWPAGFLDLTARESQQLVAQSLAKRKRDQAARDSR